MYVVMVEERPTPELKLEISQRLQTSLAKENYDGESTRTIRDRLLNEKDRNCVVVTADSRLLMFVHDIFGIENSYVCLNGKVMRLQETTRRQLRNAHNFMKMYEANAFNCGNLQPAQD